jgi:uncharacterized protein (DUF305 family)
MKNESILYGVTGLIVGVVLGVFFATNAVNNNSRGIMGIMGMNSSRVMSGDIDQHFIQQMIPHHESAIAMAELAKQKATHPEVKTLADDIIFSQSTEIQQMRDWYKSWFDDEVPITGMGRMSGGNIMMDSQASIEQLSSATDFDKALLEQMIPHHQMAVMMAEMLMETTNRPEMQKLADDIIAAQTNEINEMKLWQTQWGYETSSNNSMNMMEGMGH